MKKDSFSEKSKSLLSRNYLKMHQLFWDHEKPSAFIGSIISIRKDLGIPEDLPFKDVYKKAAGSTEKFDLLEDKYQEIQASFLKKNEDKKAILQKGVNAILRKNNLGEEWEEMITLAIITGACFPPRYNVSISCDEEKGAITFTINKDTTKNDLDVAWKYSECIRKSLFSNNKRASYPTENTFNNFKEYTESIIQKVNHPEIIEDDGLVGGRKIRKTSDKDIIALMYSDDEDAELDYSSKNDKDRLNKLRINRHRQKKIGGSKL